MTGYLKSSLEYEINKRVTQKVQGALAEAIRKMEEPNAPSDDRSSLERERDNYRDFIKGIAGNDCMSLGNNCDCDAHWARRLIAEHGQNPVER